MLKEAKHIIRYTALLPIYAYKICISPLLSNHCRYSPSCSTYAIIAIKKHGLIQGSLLTVKRILRCNPLNQDCNIYDPVPEYESNKTTNKLKK